MTQLLDEAIATIRSLPEAEQDKLARVVLRLAGVEQPAYVLSPEEEADLDLSIAAEERGDFATDEEVRAVWAKHGL